MLNTLFFLLLSIISIHLNAAEKYQPTLENTLWYIQDGCKNNELEQLIESQNKDLLFQLLNPTDKPTALIYATFNSDITTILFLFEHELIDTENLWNKTALHWALFLLTKHTNKKKYITPEEYKVKSSIIDILIKYEFLTQNNNLLSIQLNDTFSLNFSSEGFLIHHPTPWIPPLKETLLAVCRYKEDKLQTLLKSGFISNVSLNTSDIHTIYLTNETIEILHDYGIIDEPTYINAKKMKTINDAEVYRIGQMLDALPVI